MSSSDGTHAHLTSAVIHMCIPTQAWPSDLHDAGYRLYWVERKIRVTTDKHVVVDLYLYASNWNHALLFECKAGANIDDDQLDRFQHLSSRNVIEDGRVGADLSTFTYDVCYVCFGEYSERIAKGLTGTGFPLLALFERQMCLIGGSFTHSHTAKIFSSAIPLDRHKTPTGFFPFDLSSPRFKVADVVITQLIAYMARNEGIFETRMMLDKCHPLLSKFDPRAISQLTRIVNEVLREASQNEFRAYVRRSGGSRGGQATGWEIVDSPNRYPEPTRTNRWKGLRTAKAALIERLRTGEERIPLPIEI